MPNPYSCTVHGGLEIVGTSGQNLHDLMSNTDLECPLEALERLLKWGHLVPTSPDTLGCYPFEDKDPFVMARKPAVFFAANQKIIVIFSKYIIIFHEIIHYPDEDFNDSGAYTCLLSRWFIAFNWKIYQSGIT